MRRRRFLATTGLLLAACAGRRRLPALDGPHRGIALDPWRARPLRDDFQALREVGVTHVALFPFAYMRGYRDPDVLQFADPHPMMDWYLTDTGFLEIGRQAYDAGLRVVVIPTLADFLDGHWRGEVVMADDAEWDAWFRAYHRYVYRFADLAERMGAVGFSVGTELRETVHREVDWRHLIGQVRRRFAGWLTYAANWDDFDGVPWWDAVDRIGIQGYFELGVPPDDPAARVRHFDAAWAPIVERLGALSRRHDRPVLFTEIGYKSHTGAATFPWKWEIEGDPDAQLQADAYDAAFRAFWNRPWFDGFYWWKWHPANGIGLKDRTRDFTPQGKPAEGVIRKWYR